MKIEIPAFQAMAKCNEHMNHGPITLDLGPDIVMVTRCKNCTWGHEEFGRITCANPHCGKSFYGCPVPADHYCSYGEPKKGMEIRYDKEAKEEP